MQVGENSDVSTLSNDKNQRDSLLISFWKFSFSWLQGYSVWLKEFLNVTLLVHLPIKWIKYSQCHLCLLRSFLFFSFLFFKMKHCVALMRPQAWPLRCHKAVTDEISLTQCDNDRARFVFFLVISTYFHAFAVKLNIPLPATSFFKTSDAFQLRGKKGAAFEIYTVVLVFYLYKVLTGFFIHIM